MAIVRTAALRFLRAKMADTRTDELCQVISGLILNVSVAEPSNYSMPTGKASVSRESGSHADAEFFGGVEFASRQLPGCAHSRPFLTASELFGHIAESCGPPPVGVLNRCVELYYSQLATSSQ